MWEEGITSRFAQTAVSRDFNGCHWFKNTAVIKNCLLGAAGDLGVKRTSNP